MIPNCIPSITGNEKTYLDECVDTGWLSSVGPFVDRFEREFAVYHGVESACAVSSGTAAIHLGLIALDVKKDDYVLTPTTTFVGGVNPIVYCGAQPIFLDVEERTLNVSVDSLKSFLLNQTETKSGTLVYKRDGRSIAGLIVTHLYGHPAAMNEIMELCNRYKVPVLEDAAESLGAKIDGQYVGTFGDVGCFSFNGNKVITSGSGGMLISNKKEIVPQCKHLSTQAKTSSFGFFHDQIGFNYRMSNVCAAVGCAQLEKLDCLIEKKRVHAEQYARRFVDSSAWEIVIEQESVFSTYWMVLARFKGDDVDLMKKMKQIATGGIGVRPSWFPLHAMPLYSGFPNVCSNLAEQEYNKTFCLPSSVGLSEDQIGQVVDVLETI